MCGIYGCLGVSLAGRAHRNEQATARLTHRGPDNIGHWSEARIFLGHTRLSILDLHDVANQPFRDERYCLVFNGEIYNYKALQGQHLSGRELRTTSDTEVLFELLKALGPDCLPLLDGMFALAFYDTAAGALLLARDTVGIKPLYWRRAEGGLEFASEIKSLDCRPELSPLKEVVRYGCFEEGLLPYAGVQELPPGHRLMCDGAGTNPRVEPFVDLKAYIDPARCRELAERRDLDDRLEELLQESVALHLQSDAPVGSLCSGGVDSSLVSALALRHSREVRLYHAGVAGGGGEESYAQIASERLHVPIVYTKMTREEYWDVFPLVTWHNDLPIYHANDIPLYSIARRAHQDGVKVMLTGEGADELFGGYSWHRYFLSTLARFRGDRLRHPLLSKVRARLKPLLDYRAGLPYFDAGDFLAYSAMGVGYSAANLEAEYRGLAFAKQDFRSWRRWMENVDAYAGKVPDNEAPAQSFILNNLYGHLGTILHRTDRMLMANSIEGRVPFLENALFAFGLNLPLREKIRGRQGKAILKRVALRYLPRTVVYRKKAGFPVPWTSYLPEKPRLLDDGFVAEWTGLTNRQLASMYRHSPTMKFRAIALEVWGRIFVRGESWRSVRID